MIQLPEMVIGFYVWAKENILYKKPFTSCSTDMIESHSIDKINISKHQTIIVQQDSTVNNVELQDIDVENPQDQKKNNGFENKFSAMCVKLEYMDLNLRNMSFEIKNLRANLTK